MYIATTTLGSHMAVRLNLEKNIANSVKHCVISTILYAFVRMDTLQV